ncbi:ROK family protein [Streptomyces avicenniae]|uniref:ROK family protein n=1 Tax=Streptomyces avicenniae TaxID=500153 RepID=UPI000699F37A|nr:ROK family protein [Streptomyces avicenniae]
MRDHQELPLSESDRAALLTWSRARSDRSVRARIVLDAARGVSVSESARALGVSRPTVTSWRNRYAAQGLSGLEHRPRTGRPPRIDEAEVVAATLAGPPPPRRAWSARALADHLGISHTALGGVWRRWGVDGESPAPVTLPFSPPLTCHRPVVLELWRDGGRTALLLAESPAEPGRGGAPAPADERQAFAASLAAAAAGPPGGDAADTAEAPGALRETHAGAGRLHLLLWDGDRRAADPPVPGGGPTVHRAREFTGWRQTLAVLCLLEMLHRPRAARPALDSLVSALRSGAAHWRRPGDEDAPEPPPRAPRAFDQLALGSFNEKLVIESIREAGALSRVEIARRTGLTPQAVSRITRNLLTERFLVEDTHRPSGKGKPRVPLRLRADAACAVGIHLDPEMITQVLVDLCGGVVDQRQLPLRGRSDPAWVIGRMTAMAREAVAASGMRAETLLGVGISVPGPLDADAGVILDPPLFDGWRDVPLRATLAAQLGVPVTVEKDATAAAIGERWIGAAERAGDFVYLYLGTGAGCGAFLNGDVYRGRTGNAGEFGQLCALAVGRFTPDGGPAMVAECAPMSAVVDKAVAAGLDVPRRPGSYARVCAAAAAGDPRAVRAVQEVARVVAMGASGVTDLLDTTMLVVGGPAVPAPVADLYLTEIGAAVNRFPVARSVRRVHVAHSLLNESAAAMGAASGVFHASFVPRLRTHTRGGK